MALFTLTRSLGNCAIVSGSFDVNRNHAYVILNFPPFQESSSNFPGLPAEMEVHHGKPGFMAQWSLSNSVWISASKIPFVTSGAMTMALSHATSVRREDTTPVTTHRPASNSTNIPGRKDLGRDGDRNCILWPSLGEYASGGSR